MRKIRFRVWNGIYSEFETVMGLKFEKHSFAVLGEDEDERCLDNHDTPYTLEQYTGLKDKNDTDIYEGDVIKIPTHYIMYGTNIDDWSDDYALVEWSERYGGFFIYGETPLWEVLFEGHPKDGFYHKFPEIVGNIHENPELLEGDENE